MLDPEGHILRFNAACERTTGYRFDEVRGRSIWDFLLPEETTAVREVFDTLHDGAARNQHVNYWVTRDGERRLIAWSNSAVTDSAGRVSHILGTGIDITERMAAENALEQSEAELSAILNAAVDAIITITEDGTIRSVNRATARLFGYDMAEMVGENVKLLMPQPDRDRHDGFLRRYLETGDKRIIGIGREVMAERKDGSRFPVQLSISEAIFGARRLFTGIVHDISLRKEAEALNLRLGRIVEASVNEVLVFDSESLRFVQANQAAIRSLGYSLDELVRLTPSDIEPDLDPAALAARLDPLRTGALEQAVFETRHRRKSGETYEVRVQLQLVRTEAPPLFIAVVENVTEVKAREAQLQQAMKMEAVGQLTGGVAHDFNNLLTVILGNLEMLEIRMTADETTGGLLKEAQEAAELGAELTGRLLAFARRQPLAPKVIDVNALVLEMSELLRRTLGEAIQINTALANGLPQTCVDPGQLQNALLNLAINARDAMSGAGSLTIETRAAILDETYTLAHPDVPPGSYVELSVSDSGCGMAPDVQARAFEPFFTTKQSASGTGLGLSMVYGFAKQSKGHVRLYSELGTGTTVSLYLPPAETVAETEAPGLDLSDDLQGRGETVLVVEDDERVRRTSVARLEQLGYRVLQADRGEAALRILAEAGRIDLLFTDVIMPGDMNGPELAEEVLRRAPGTRVLFTTGFAEAAVLGQEGPAQPGQEILRKPYRLTDLAGRVRTILDA